MVNIYTHKNVPKEIEKLFPQVDTPHTFIVAPSEEDLPYWAKDDHPTLGWWNRYVFEDGSLVICISSMPNLPSSLSLSDPTNIYLDQNLLEYLKEITREIEGAEKE